MGAGTILAVACEATVRLWSVDRGCPLGHPITVTAGVASLRVLGLDGGVSVLAAGTDMIARVDVPAATLLP